MQMFVVSRVPISIHCLYFRWQAEVRVVYVHSDASEIELRNILFIGQKLFGHVLEKFFL